MSTKGYVDADGHVRDRDRHYRRYLEEPYNRRLAVSGGPGDTFDRPMFETLGGPEDVTAAIWLSMLDQGGVESTVLYPTTGLTVGFIQEPDFAVAFCRAYNSYLSEEFIKVSPRLQAVALVPLQDPAEAARELRRAVTELHMCGVMLPADGPFLLGSRQLDPLYDEAQRLDAMVAVHGTGSLRGRGLDEYLFHHLLHAHTLSHSGAQMRQMTSIVYDGVLERFPNLRIAFLEAGCTWVPYWMDHMDEEFEFRGQREAPTLTRKPSDYVRSPNVYVACEPEEQLLPQALRIIGEDSVLYASDFPHWDGTYPQSLHELEGREDLTEEQKHRILIDNPKRLYGLA